MITNKNNKNKLNKKNYLVTNFSLKVSSLILLALTFLAYFLAAPKVLNFLLLKFLVTVNIFIVFVIFPIINIYKFNSLYTLLFKQRLGE